MGDGATSIKQSSAPYSGSLDDDARYLAVRSRDSRFDGVFFVAVTSTGIYCRPSCPSPPASAMRVRFFPTAAAAQRAGFRACKRCIPDATPGSPEWDRRADVVGRAMRLIADGVVDREGVPGLARRLGYSERHLNRVLIGEVGAGPLALARAQRAQTARILLETTQLRAGEIAFAAGFSSIRQFNDTIQEVFALAPMALRDRARARHQTRSATWAVPGTISLRLAYRSPLQTAPLFGFLAARAVAGVEEGDLERYRRVLSLPHGSATAEVSSAAGSNGYLRCLLALEDVRDLTAAVRRLRRLFDLDADPLAVVEALGSDPVLGTSVAAMPGLRTPGHVDGDELALRAVLGQQVSVAGASRLASRLAHDHGRKLGEASGSLTCLFPSAAVIASLQPSELPMPGGRARAVIRLACALASGEVVLDGGADWAVAAERLLAIPGIGPWTVAYIAMRALGDPDAFMASDLGVRRGLEARGLAGDPRSAEVAAEAWRPWRSYALQYLWTTTPARPGDEKTDRRQAARKEQAA
ncbi:MAG: AlkA N-terminal domain-containing protein [Acidimicrobiales bacterium]|jgi:AraC family transcriptional regulator of adaptative response / DNA-3-methyladenine glycosylase II